MNIIEHLLANGKLVLLFQLAGVGKCWPEPGRQNQISWRHKKYKDAFLEVSLYCNTFSAFGVKFPKRMSTKKLKYFPQDENTQQLNVVHCIMEADIGPFEYSSSTSCEIS